MIEKLAFHRWEFAVYPGFRLFNKKTQVAPVRRALLTALGARRTNSVKVKIVDELPQL